MRFKEWLLQEDVMSRGGVDISTPENIEYLSQLPNPRLWAKALASKYTAFLMNFVNHGNAPYTLMAGKQPIEVDPNMPALIKQLKKADIHNLEMSPETNSGSMMRLPQNETAAQRAFLRLLNKWIYVSLGLSLNMLDKNGVVRRDLPNYNEIMASIGPRLENLSIKDLKSNVGIMWTPNKLQKSHNKYDDPAAEEAALWKMAKTLGLKSSKEMKGWILQTARAMFQNYPPPEKAEERAQELFQYVMDNLMQFDPNNFSWKDLKFLMEKRRIGILRRKGEVNRYDLNVRRNDYNQQQVASNFSQPTQEPYRMEDDPRTLRNRMNAPVIPMPMKNPLLAAMAGKTTTKPAAAGGKTPIDLRQLAAKSSVRRTA